MKTHKILAKGMALCLTLLMAVGVLATTAFAIGQDDRGTITVNSVEDGVAVSAYRLMVVKVNENGQPQEPVYSWTSAVAGWVRTNYQSYIGTGSDNSVQPAFSTASTDEIATFYDKLAAAIRGGKSITLNAAQTATASDGTASLEGLLMGNYLILIENGMKVYRPSAVNLVPKWNAEANEGKGAWQMASPAVVEVKFSDMSITKTVKAPGTATGKEADNANIGDTLTYEIVTDVPKFPANALAKNYTISDILPDSVSLADGSIQVYGVKSGSADMLLTIGDGGAYTQDEARPNSGGPSTFTLTFDYSKISNYDKIRVTYTAVLNGDAALGADGNVNTAYLEYSNDPYTENSWKTQTDSAKVYTYGLDISKVDKDDHNTFLPGAEFQLYASQEDATNKSNPIKFVEESDGVYRRATASDTTTTDTLAVGTNGALTGKLTLKGLDEATWYLLETKAPNEYNLLASPVAVEIKDTDATTDVLDGKVQGAAEGAAGEAAAMVALTVENDDGFQLPVTGGMGTILFTAVGVVLMGAAVVLVIVAVKKRKAANTSRNQ